MTARSTTSKSSSSFATTATAVSTIREQIRKGFMGTFDRFIRKLEDALEAFMLKRGHHTDDDIWTKAYLKILAKEIRKSIFNRRTFTKHKTYAFVGLAGSLASLISLTTGLVLS